MDAHEGPVYVPGEDALYFTSVPRPGPRVDIKRLDLGSLTVSVIRPDAAAANGMTLGHDGRLIVCEQIGGAIAAVDRRDRRRGAARRGLQLAQRRRREERRHDLVHGSELRLAPGLPAAAAPSGRRVAIRPANRQRDRGRRLVRQAQRALLLAGRAHAVRGRQRRAAPPQGLRRPGRRAARRRARDPRELAGASGRPEGRLGGTAVRDLRRAASRC